MPCLIDKFTYSIAREHFQVSIIVRILLLFYMSSARLSQFVYRETVDSFASGHSFVLHQNTNLWHWGWEGLAKGSGVGPSPEDLPRNLWSSCIFSFAFPRYHLDLNNNESSSEPANKTQTILRSIIRWNSSVCINTLVFCRSCGSSTCFIFLQV